MTADPELDTAEHRRFMTNHDWREIAERTLNLYVSALSRDTRLGYAPARRMAETQQ